MTQRWKMNRIGFVNFWLYDEEDFEFVNGKLLLRGQNASGKSITTQSFIPFVLDGDRTPNRLDPFGSSDRRMEYYFIGEDEKDEATGYLFLEFVKAQTGEYRTIGIGQKAKRGKSMDFWGFIISDGRRIGYDLNLYKEVGSTKIPLDRRELKALLGENNFFTDSQSEYKKNVNQSIFGFRKSEQYEQFIKLLVKVRAPKLSKEFKPTRVYEILNDSLQTLTDEDLRTMVDAMEKMDEIQESLELLNRAFLDVKIIRNEYTRYNQYMLAKKAQAYLTKKQEVESSRARMEAQELEKQQLETEGTETKEHLQQLEEERQILIAERSSLMDSNLEEMDQKLAQAKEELQEARVHEKRWEDKIAECKERIFDGQRALKKIQERLEEHQEALADAKQRLTEQQDILQWEQHNKALQQLETETYESKDEILNGLDLFRRILEECKRAISRYEELCAQYDEIAKELDALKKQKAEQEILWKAAQETTADSVDQWITDIYAVEKAANEWHPKKEVLQKSEELIRQYTSVVDAGAIQELLRRDYDAQRQHFSDQKLDKEYAYKLQLKTYQETEEELFRVRSQKDLEPIRTPETQGSRAALLKEGITAVPFYKTVEFSKTLEGAKAARLEAQLAGMGILDALVVSPEDFERIRRDCPEFLDTVLYVKESGHSTFSGLVISEELEDGLRDTVRKILSNIYEEKFGQGIYLGKDGSFCNGLLAGRADKIGDAEYVGTLARKRRKEQRIEELNNQLCQMETDLHKTEDEIKTFENRIACLQEEYRMIPGFSAINAALAQEKEKERELELVCAEYRKLEQKEHRLAGEKNEQYQIVLKQCKPYPYARTADAYEEAAAASEEYRAFWQEARQSLQQIGIERSSYRIKEESIEREEQVLDDAFIEKRNYSTKSREAEVRIRQYEEYLSRPEIVEQANRLKELRERLEQTSKEYTALDKHLAVLDERIRRLIESEPKQREELTQAILEETELRKYFEEELSLKLLIDRGSRTLLECAQEALGLLRESDKMREAGELLQSLYKVYQGHNGTLTNYGTSLEDCFDAVDTASVFGETANVTRRRVRVVSVWNGKKVYLEEFYAILKTAIDETELLIQRKDRELFENILSQTISQQLTDRIAESRKWVRDMSQLMKEMDTSMGLHFSLDWKPRKAENDMELGTAELEQILLRDRALLSVEDIEKVAAHFRSKIRMEKQRLEEDGGIINYMELVRDALDYRKWFEFQMYFRRGEESKKLLTNAAFNRFSGGEKAMAMYVPLFAAVNAQYQKAENKDHPRMIALDEAFAGVDDKNISSMFDLVQKLDFDYIMNSQALWGCFETVDGLRIAELFRPENSQVVSVIRYTWNGHERILDVQ